ncbi:proline-rich receptor-like protein kinase PERK2 isoform X3 [Primulina eburnea]|uniref:proline-rich receptor-like protein kinase PERK2 isoform X3 n=1 Tax=Primulina eburnea TaxID=1245227 RepID=UPI003C6C3584
MASSVERSSFINRSTPLMPGRVVIAYDATKNQTSQVFRDTITNIRKQDGMIQEGDTITVLGVLHKALHPMGFHMKIGPDSLFGTHARVIKEDSARKLGAYVSMLQRSADECQGNGISIEVKIAVGAPVEKVVLQEVTASNATWVVLDWHLRKELRYYLKRVPCKVALVLENSTLDVMRPYCSDSANGVPKHKLVYSLSKPVLVSPTEDIENNERSVISSAGPEIMNSMEDTEIQKSILVTSLSCNSKEPDFSMQEEFGSNSPKEKLGSNAEFLIKYDESAPVLSTSSGLEMESGSMRYSYSEINIATDNFSPDNLLGEERYGVVYKGQLENGQLISAKVQKEANTQGIPEFLRFACHKNIQMFLGYCCNEDFNILVYEFVCNKSLERHLLDNTEPVLDWHRRHSISIGIAKGLRFLHEECRGSPIIHGYLRPCNVLLTHDFDPLLGNCGLTSKNNKSTTTHATSIAYHAPEFAENGTFSIKTDVYAFGIVLIQLITGQRCETAVFSRSNNNQSLLQWALPLIEMLAVDELVDPRLGDSYSIYELYNMANAACLCIQTEPETRPSMGEVLRLLEGKSVHL